MLAPAAPAARVGSAALKLAAPPEGRAAVFFCAGALGAAAAFFGFFCFPASACWASQAAKISGQFTSASSVSHVASSSGQPCHLTLNRLRFSSMMRSTS
jgi:hypothetical protein